MGFRTSISAERYMTPIKGEAVVKLDGIDLQQYGFILTQYPNLAFPNKRNRYQNINHSDGMRNYGGVYDNWTYELTGVIAGISHADLLLRLDEFKSAFDFHDTQQFEYILNAIGPHGHFFEISGHKHWYTAGTVSGTTTTITGTNTQWTKYIQSGAEIEFNGHSTKYYVLQVVSDTELEITPTLTASLSGSTYRVERKRYLLINLEGEGSFAAFSNPGMLSQTKLGSNFPTKASNFYTTSLQLSTQVPYWLGDPFTHIETNLASGSFIEILGIGNANISPIIRIVGAVNNPYVTASEMGFHKIFRNSLKGQALRTSPTGTYNIATSLSTGKLGQAYNQSINFNAMANGTAPSDAISSAINRNQGTLSGWFRVGFASTDTNTRILFTDNAATNRLTLQWNGSSSRFEITDGTNTAFINPGAYVIDTWFHIVGEWHTVNNVDTGVKAQIWVNNVAGTGSASYLSGTPGSTLYLGSDSNLSNIYSGLMDDIAIWDSALPTADITILYNSGNGNPAPFVNSEPPLFYLPLDGTGTPTGSNLGSIRDITININSLTSTSIGVSDGGSVFINNQLITIYDEPGYSESAFVNGTPSNISIPIDDGAGGAIAVDKVGKFATLNGSTDYFIDSNTSNQDITTGDFFMSCYVKTTAATQQVLMVKGSNIASANGYYLYLDANGKANVTVRGTTTAQTLTSTLACNDGKWHHIGVCFDASSASTSGITIDGMQDAIFPSLGIGSLTNAVGFSVGADGNGNNKFNGSIRDIKFYGSGATAFLPGNTPQLRENGFDLASQIFTSITISGRVPDVIYLMTESTLGTDSSGNGRNLSINGTPANGFKALVSSNIMPRPDETDGSVGGWVRIGAWNGISPTQDFSKSTTIIQKNAHSLHILLTANAHEFERKFKLEKGKIYKISFWYTTNNDVTSPVVSIKDKTVITTYATSLTDDTNWHYYEMIVPVTDSGALLHDFVFSVKHSGSGNRTLYINSFLIGESLFTGGDCESTTGWNAIGTVTISTTGAGHAGNGLSLSADNTEGAEKSMSPLANTWFETSCWLRISTTGTSAVISLQGFSDIMETTTGTVTNLTTTYVKRSLITRFISDVVGTFRIISSSTQSILIDDIGLTMRYGVNINGISTTAIPIFLPIGVKMLTSEWINYSSDIIGNPTQCGFFVRFRADFGSTDGNDHFIFSWTDDATGANAFKLFYRASDDKWVFRIRSGGSNVDTFASDVAQIFSSGNIIELSGWYHHGGRLDEKDNITYYGKLFVNKIEMAKLTSTITKPAVNLNQLRINSDSPISGSYGLITLDELGLWVHASTDEELMSYHDNGFDNQNNTLSATVILAANDILSISTSNMRGEKYTSSGNTVSRVEIDGSPTSFKGHDNTESQILYVTASGTIPELIFLFRPSWR